MSNTVHSQGRGSGLGSRRDRAGRGVVVPVVLGLLLTLLGVGGTLWWQQRDPDPVLSGQVVSPTGRPIKGAVVTAAGGETRAGTDAQGRFTLVGESTWVTATADGWVPRTRVIAAGDPIVIRLLRDRPGTVTFTFGGDVMFGRRYFDPGEDGSMGGLLEPDAGPDAHAALLEGVAPLLSGADLTAVNLETPLVPNPAYDLSAVRPPAFHPTKEYAFASAPTTAQALVDLGVDVVDLGNNHLFDRLEDGVDDTRESLTAAGLAPGEGSFGAGQDAAQAWQPAIRTVEGRTVALLGCTSITGDDQPLTYVASPTKGGAARCKAERLRREVAAAARAADIVVVMLHGGYEYGREPSPQVRGLTNVAVDAGATMVINHHPHVVGGLRFDDGVLSAWSMGNLLFDQTVWSTFDSYVLTVAVRGDRVVGAWAEAIRLQNYRPTGVHGPDADWVARGTLARSVGPWVVDDGSLWLDTAGAARTSTRELAPGTGQLYRLTAACAPGAGRELLWTGDFEDRDLQPASAGTTSEPAAPRPAALWNATTEDPYRSWEADVGRTGAGIRLYRAERHEDDVLLNPLHRVLVTEGDRLTFLVDLRAEQADPEVKVQLSWYNDTQGSSQSQTVAEVQVSSSWQTYRIDVVVPANALAVMPLVRLRPPDDDVVQVAIDNVRLIDFDEPGCDYLAGGAGQISSTTLPPEAAAPGAAPVTSTRLPVPQPARLPPTPPDRREAFE